MDIKVSVIIPVYNAEKYLADCIESLLNQSLKECEFIFINDGSEDNSRRIIEKYKETDKRIILFNQENQGVSAARNKGLEIASGEYAGFVDADDYIDQNLYQNLYQTAKENDCEVAISNIKCEMGDNEELLYYPIAKGKILNREYIKTSILPYLIMKENLNSVCNKIYQFKLIKENKITFPQNLCIGEDGIFNLYFFSLSQKAFYLDYSGYIYREAEGSATRNFLKQDYLQRAIEIYLLDLPEIIKNSLDASTIQRLKSIKLINSLKAQLYLASSANMNFIQKRIFIKRVITNQFVQEALAVYCSDQIPDTGRYDKFLVKMMKNQSILGIYFATLYSRLRNK